jgi:hypothetical protein
MVLYVSLTAKDWRLTIALPDTHLPGFRTLPDTHLPGFRKRIFPSNRVLSWFAATPCGPK